MRFLLDTNICIYALKQHQAVLTRLLSERPIDVGLSVITEAELRTGAAKSTASTRTTRLLENFLRPLTVVEFTSEDAVAYAAVRAKLEHAGTPHKGKTTDAEKRLVRDHLDQTLTVRQLAARANMSERTFARRFVQDTGTTPQRWLIGQRILLAQQLLEESDETVDAIADHTGFGNATALRHHFRAWRGTTPIAYRRLFRGDPAGRPPGAPARKVGHGRVSHSQVE